MEAMKNRVVAFALAIIAILSLTLGSSLAAPPKHKVAYIINGALGDLSFYDSGQEGIDRMRKELNAETRTIECNFDPVAYPQALQSAVAWGADVIFVVSYGFEDLLMQDADTYPDKKWINLDTVVENKKKTITSVDFIEEEGAFMAGVVAGLVTTDTSIPGVNRDKVVGAVCGDDDPVIRGFLYRLRARRKAYRQGY